MSAIEPQLSPKLNLGSQDYINRRRKKTRTEAFFGLHFPW